MSQILTFNYERKFFLFRQICNENIISMFSSRTNLIQRFIRDAFCLFINGYRGCYRDFACLRRIFYCVSLQQRKLAKGETFRDSRRDVNVEFAQWNSLNGIRFFYSHVRARARTRTHTRTYISLAIAVCHRLSEVMNRSRSFKHIPFSGSRCSESRDYNRFSCHRG